MTTNSTDFMPYAPAEPVVRVIRRFRERGLSDPINRKTLPQLGVAEGNADRIEKTLAFLGLIDDEGHRTPTFDRLGKASTDEYPKVLAEVVRAAYAPILTIVNPSEDGDVAVTDSFRPYGPAGQRPRMVSLFIGLCREAGIISGGPVQRQARAKPARPASPGSTPKSDQTPKPTGTKHEPEEPHDGIGLDLRLLSGLIQQLPKDARWTQAKRDRWLQAVTATVDLLIEVEPEGS